MHAKTITGLAAGLLLTLPSVAQEPAQLGVGDQAPALHVAEWVKGAAVPSLQAGNVYIVEFWATW